MHRAFRRRTSIGHLYSQLPADLLVVLAVSQSAGFAVVERSQDDQAAVARLKALAQSRDVAPEYLNIHAQTGPREDVFCGGRESSCVAPKATGLGVAGKYVRRRHSIATEVHDSEPRGGVQCADAVTTTEVYVMEILQREAGQLVDDVISVLCANRRATWICAKKVMLF